MKLFELQEANALIPTVRRIVRALQRAHGRLQRYKEEVEAASEKALTSGGGGITGGNDYAATLLRLLERSAELEALGVQLKDYALGLVDFPTLREGRVVLLCWRLGEGDELQWWHETDAGFAGRQPL